MLVCMCMCMCVCICVSVCVWMYVCVRMCVRVFVCICVHVHACLRVLMCICLCMGVCVCILPSFPKSGQRQLVQKGSHLLWPHPSGTHRSTHIYVRGRRIDGAHASSPVTKGRGERTWWVNGMFNICSNLEPLANSNLEPLARRDGHE